MPETLFAISSPDENFCSALRDQFEEDHQVIISTHLSTVLSLLTMDPIDILLIDQRWELSDGAVAERVLNMLFQKNESARALILVREDMPPRLQAFKQNSNIKFLSGNITTEGVQSSLAEEVVETKAVEEAGQTSEPEQQTTVPESPPITEPTPVVKTENDRKSAGFGETVFPGVTRNFETRSPQMKTMLEDLMVAASHDVTILLIGETGAGKTFLSNLVHEASPRKDEPFITVACGALPRDLIESELFGHVKGSFTSAHADKDGKFLAAGRGTILLDEIDVLLPEQQVKLLRVIETGQFEPVGSNQTMTSQARLVVASNLDLEPLVEAGKFRPDLYYRLNMMKFDLLPLRKRKMDVIPMAKKFIQKFQQKHNIQINRIDDSMLDAMLSYPWPGNVRELEHVMQRAVIYCKDGTLTRDHLPANILAGQVGPTNDPTVQLGRRDQNCPDHSLEQQVSLSEKEIIEQALFKNNFSRTNTAKELGISRVALYNKMKKYDMMK